MLRIQLKATTSEDARRARASVVKALQNVAEDGMVPSVTVEEPTMGDIYMLEVNY